MISDLRFWCQKVLPFVYDDSLSYYEAICKMGEKINEIIQVANDVPNYIKEAIKDVNISQIVAEIISSYVINVKYPPLPISPAKGDGDNDDGATIQTCIDYLKNTGGIVFLPSGIYKSSPLTLKNNVSLIGASDLSTKIFLAPSSSDSLITANVSNGVLGNLILDGNISSQITPNNVLDFTSDSFRIYNCKIANGNILVNGTASKDFKLENVKFDGSASQGLNISGDGSVTGRDILFSTKNPLTLNTDTSLLENIRFDASASGNVSIAGTNNVVKYWNESNVNIHSEPMNSVQNYVEPPKDPKETIDPDNFSGTDTEKIQSAFDAAITGARTIVLYRSYNVTKVNIKRTDMDTRLNVYGFGNSLNISDGIYGSETETICGGVNFIGINFIGTTATSKCFVVTGQDLIRLHFNNCTFTKFQYVVNSNSILQQFYFNQCYFRANLVTVVQCSTAYACSFMQCSCEDCPNFFNSSDTAYNCSFVSNTIENLRGTALTFKTAICCYIGYNYFELNKLDIDFTNSENSIGVTIVSNWFYGVHTNAISVVLPIKNCTNIFGSIYDNYLYNNEQYFLGVQPNARYTVSLWGNSAAKMATEATFVNTVVNEQLKTYSFQATRTASNDTLIVLPDVNNSFPFFSNNSFFTLQTFSGPGKITSPLYVANNQLVCSVSTPGTYVLDVMLSWINR